MVVEYPNARLVDDALYGVTVVVEYYGLEGQWVMSRASSAPNEIYSTGRFREVSGCVASTIFSASFLLFTGFVHRSRCRQ